MNEKEAYQAEVQSPEKRDEVLKDFDDSLAEPQTPVSMISSDATADPQGVRNWFVGFFLTTIAAGLISSFMLGITAASGLNSRSSYVALVSFTLVFSVAALIAAAKVRSRCYENRYQHNGATVALIGWAIILLINFVSVAAL
jgi:hypothetical protein